MKILLSNDDGIFAQGIRTLANTLAAASQEVYVVCPDRERSATGHGLTLHKPIRADVVEHLFDASVRAWACSGTPADCVKLALGALVETPDLVISGINHGSNLGTDILYSGTVSAAMEGTIEGIPAIAMSLASFSWQDFQPAAQVARYLVSWIEKQSFSSPFLLNVNVPPCPLADIPGLRLTRQGLRRYFDQFEQRVDPRGKTYYWLAGEVVEDIEAAPGLPESVVAALAAVPTDVQAVGENWVSLTPLQYNLTAVTGLTQSQDQLAGLDELLKTFNKPQRQIL